MKSKSTLYSRYFTYIKPIAKLPIIKNYAPAIFTLTVMTVLILFAIKPTVETILVLQKKLADSEEVLQKVTKKVDDLSLGKTNYDSLDAGIKEKITAAIPDTLYLRSIAQTLEQVAQRNDASISALQIEPLVIVTKTENQVGSLSEISFTFNTEGTYQKLVSLLQDLKTSSRLMSINRVSIAEATESKTLIMSLSGKAYYFK